MQAANTPIKSTGWSYSATSQLPTTIVERETPFGSTAATETGRWTYVYSALGDVNKITDGSNTTTSATITSNSTGQFTKITTSNGAVANFAWNTRGAMTQAAIPELTSNFVIDARGLVTEVRFSDGRWLRYTYNASQKLTQITDQSGNTQIFAGLSKQLFDNKDFALSALAWLERQAAKFGEVLVPSAQAQAAQVVVPATIIIGIFILADANKPRKSNSGECCVGSGTPNEFGGGPGGGKPSWLQQVSTMLTPGPASPSPEPIYDKAGNLVAPRATCLAPPGDCEPDKHRQLQDEVNEACNVPRECKGSMLKAELLDRLDKQSRCAKARDKINKTCFAGGDKGHRDQALGAWEGAARCAKFLSALP